MSPANALTETTSERRRRVSGWGYEGDQGLSGAQQQELQQLVSSVFSLEGRERREAKQLDAVELREPRLRPPAALAGICHTDTRTRCLHAQGRSYADVARAFRGEFATAPDVVATPGDAQEVAAVLEWCAEAGAACIPFGGGTSVVGGVTPPAGDGPVVTLQMRRMDRVLDVDRTSRTALIQAGATGPRLESQLAEHGLTLHHTPQSWELATLGGWLATRSAGHFGMGSTRIDDLAEQITAITPVGEWTSLRVPGDGAGPDPDRLLLGSEGALGVITEARMRVMEPPAFRASATVEFPSFEDGARAVRDLAQARVHAEEMRLLEGVEAGLTGFGGGERTVLLLGFESQHESVAGRAGLALEICRAAGGDCPGGADLRERTALGSDDELWTRWRESFLRAPHQRDLLVSLGVIVETFETALPWSTLPEGRVAIQDAARKALEEVCGAGLVTCRISHAYEDGAAPYFTVIAPARVGAEDSQWLEVKAAATEAVLEAGGSVTHHHAVGRDHQPWYERQRSEAYAAALAAAKRAVDPDGLLNPGVLV